MTSLQTCKFCHRSFLTRDGEALPVCSLSTPLIPYTCQGESSGERMVRELAQGVAGRLHRRRRGRR